MGEVIAIVFGSLLASLPLVLVLLAWRSLHRFQPVQVRWRKHVFAVALFGTAVSYVWFWLVFLAFPQAFSFEVYEKVGRTSQRLALIFIVLSFAGTGLSRLFAVAGAVGVAVLWVTIGFW